MSIVENASKLCYVNGTWADKANYKTCLLSMSKGTGHPMNDEVRKHYFFLPCSFLLFFSSFFPSSFLPSLWFLWSFLCLSLYYFFVFSSFLSYLCPHLYMLYPNHYKMKPFSFAGPVHDMAARLVYNIGFICITIIIKWRYFSFAGPNHRHGSPLDIQHRLHLYHNIYKMRTFFLCRAWP